MKTGILTLPLWNNYGGILQAYALKEALKKLGHTPVLIDYHHKKSNIFTALKENAKREIRINIKRGTPYYPSIKEKQFISKHTLKFIDKEFEGKTDRADDNVTLSAVTESFGAIIAGSDQIWRPNYAPNIFNFFLDFAQPRQTKLAYAASFGTDEFPFSKQQTEACKHLLQKFDDVSVREDSGVKLCKAHFNVEAEQLADPVFLLDAIDYQKFISEKTSQKSSGKLFSYVLDQTKEKKQLIREIAAHKNLGVFETMPKPFDKNFKKNKPAYRLPPVENWLKSFVEADFVVTDSFHGCAFSLIFNKPFIALGNKERGLARFTSLLRLFNLEDRLVTSKNEMNFILLEKTVNWDIINRIIIDQQQKSFGFLKRNLSYENRYFRNRCRL